MSNEQKSFTMDKKKVLALLILFLTISLIVIYRTPRVEATNTTNPKFVLASWDYPDEYGQGILQIQVEENSTGSWEPVELRDHSKSQDYEWNASLFIRLRIWTWLNNSVVGAVDLDDGENYQRLNATVTAINGTTVFNQQNLTFFVSYDTENPMWLYQHYVVLDFLPDYNQIYTATVTYEVFHESASGYGSSYLHTCSDTNNMTYSSDGGLDPTDYGIGSNGIVVEAWIVPDSVADEYVIYKLEFTNIANTDGDVNVTARYRVEDGFTAFRFDLYYDDATSESTGIQTSQTWTNVTIDAENGKTLDYILLRCDDNPNTVTSGNRSIYIDFIEITSETGSLTYLVDDWNEVSIATLYFRVSFHPWGFDTALIILGLCMIPASTIYLVFGGRKNLSSDKVFYALIAFLLGWGLVIAGILP